ncbi:tumor necrosis factor receptor superfamily member 26-like isoform X1 [Haemorhous mexicanus]|uniref:tumor necrosis factor receptor superfamily member 26-like isoform X1 n=1 Tax=Haemorhous mexicanus TaxID=30427 RepID=UPI0028BF071C|nr:tumor necrosis factor receptor superfamily member 26-like isoform X1 [Haemorhous mexicanus]
MGAVMGAGRAVGLLLAVLLTMPRARASCGEREYFHQGLCCVFCEAGTFVADHCNASHLKGKCDPCKEGKGFTAYANGLEECLPCRRCKEDQITLRPCTLTQNAECQCKQGYFCDDEGCEMCRRISQEHPDGNEILLNSTDTAELGLTNQGKEARVWVIPVLLSAGLGLLVVVVVVVKKLKCDKAASTVKDVEGHLKKIVESSVVSEKGTVPCRSWKCCMTAWLRRIAKSSLAAKPVQNSAFQQTALSNVPHGTPANCKVQEPSQIIVKDLSLRELRETFDVFTKEVPPQQWKRLMGTLLQENNIDKIISKFPNNREEQSHQMLLIWKNKLGKKQ